MKICDMKLILTYTILFYLNYFYTFIYPVGLWIKKKCFSFLFLKNYLSLMYSLSPRPIISPIMGSSVVVRCVDSFRLPTVLTSFLRFWLLVCLYLEHSSLRCIHKIWNYEESNLRPNLVIEFFDLHSMSYVLLICSSSNKSNRRKEKQIEREQSKRLIESGLIINYSINSRFQT